MDYGCACLLNPQADTLSVLVSGVKARPQADTLGLQEGATIAVSQAGLREFLEGRTVYVPDTTQSGVPLLKKFAEAGLRSVAISPLFVESLVSGLLVIARPASDGFSSRDCEFLRMLGEHLGLAIHQGQLYTQLQRAYEDLRQTQQVVLQQERLGALGQMASGIAHDINNALSPAALYVESLLEREAGLSDRGREYLTTIQQALGDVAHTIGRMREFYRPREAQATLLPVRLTQVVEQVVELTRPRWRDLPQQRGIVIDLRTDLPADLPPILGIESDLRDACTNLIFNAVDAMPQGGTLTLRTFQEAEGRTQKAEGGKQEAGEAVGLPSASRPLPSVVVEVSDTGVGMDAETRLRCLEPFFTTKGERGTG
ncbi:MAG: histidine kinase dimerization/phospho-acceptor domain-containing protein, partial [candidate division NC10 bacterium]